MQPVGNERPPANFQGRPLSPFPATSQSSTPFLSPRPAVGLAPPTASQIPPPVVSSVGIGALTYPHNPPPSTPVGANFRPTPPVRFNGPSSPPTSSYPVATAQSVAPFGASTVPGRPITPPPGALRPQFPSVPMGYPPQSVNPVPPSLAAPILGSYTNVLPGGNIPGQPQIPPLRPISQPPFQGPPSAQVPPSHAPYQGHQRGLMLPPSSVGPPPSGFGLREQMQYPSMGPPLGGAMQGLVEEFQSLSVGSGPGSLDLGVDHKSLPRPLDTNGEPTTVLDSYPVNCHPRYFRLTTQAIPSSQSLLARWHLPLGAVVHPLAEDPNEEEVPLVNFGSAGIIRCRRCRTYVNPYVTFTDLGRKWRCNLCSLLNDVPSEYFCALDASGRRCDIEERPELSRGSVEFVAPTEYMIRPPMPPVYFFVIDVSVSAVKSGMLEVLASTIKACLDRLPGFPRTQIGFLTFDTALHFYCLKSSLTQPQMMVVSDLDDLFLPLPDDLLVNLADSRHVVDAFLDSLPTMFQGNVNMESAFGPALKAAFMVMSQLGGKLLVFQTALPSLGVGRLRLRGDDPRIYGTDKEHTLRVPDDPFYKQTAAEFTKHQIAVDIFAFGDKYSDIASLGTLAKYTGGQLYYYPSFRAAIHQEKFRHELTRDLTRETAWEAVMRIRCGKGIRFSTYHGHFMLRSTDLLALPAVDSDKAFGMQLALEETLLTTQTVYFQVALLYTSSSGERRIRVLTAAAPVVSDLGEMYRHADAGAIVSLLGRLAIEKTLSSKLEDARQFLQLKLVKSLKEYRNLYVVQHRLVGRLIYPESLKFLPLYVLALCKSVALRGGYADTPLDDRCGSGYRIMILPIGGMLKLLYPSLMRIDENLTQGASNPEEVLRELPLTAESLDPRGLYMLDDGFDLIIWFGRMMPSELVSKILGVDLSTYPDISSVALSERDNEVSKQLMSLLKRQRKKDPSYYQLCHIVRQGEQPREGSLLLSRLVEDHTAGSVSYVDWILQIHRQSQSP